MYFVIIGPAPNVNPEWYKPYWQPGLEGVQQRNPFNPGPDNPFLDMYEMLNKMQVKRIKKSDLNIKLRTLPDELANFLSRRSRFSYKST